jgi:very-short-patch-repair endonuclease
MKFSNHIKVEGLEAYSLSIIAVIELDDKSHSNEKIIRRDDFVNEVCRSAGIKLIRFKAKSGYQIQHVRDVINTAIGFNT